MPSSDRITEQCVCGGVATWTGSTQVCDRPTCQFFALTDAELDEARGWLSDCDFAETELMTGEERADLFASMTAKVIEAGVERHYDGGLEAFVVASGLR